MKKSNRAFHKQPDWWLHHAVDSYIRVWICLNPERTDAFVSHDLAGLWEQRMWFELLKWAAEEPLEWQIWW